MIRSYVTSLLHKCDMPHSYVLHDSCVFYEQCNYVSLQGREKARMKEIELKKQSQRDGENAV